MQVSGRALDAKRLQDTMMGVPGVKEVNVSRYIPRKGAVHLDIRVSPAADGQIGPPAADGQIGPPPADGQIGPNKGESNGGTGTAGAQQGHVGDGSKQGASGAAGAHKTRIHVEIAYDLEVIGPRDLRDALIVCYRCHLHSIPSLLSSFSLYSSVRIPGLAALVKCKTTLGSSSQDKILKIFNLSDAFG